MQDKIDLKSSRDVSESHRANLKKKGDDYFELWKAKKAAENSDQDESYDTVVPVSRDLGPHGYGPHGYGPLDSGPHGSGFGFHTGTGTGNVFNLNFGPSSLPAGAFAGAFAHATFTPTPHSGSSLKSLQVQGQGYNSYLSQSNCRMLGSGSVSGSGPGSGSVRASLPPQSEEEQFQLLKQQEEQWHQRDMSSQVSDDDRNGPASGASDKQLLEKFKKARASAREVMKGAQALLAEPRKEVNHF